MTRIQQLEQQVQDLEMEKRRTEERANELESRMTERSIGKNDDFVAVQAERDQLRTGSFPITDNASIVITSNFKIVIFRVGEGQR